MRSHAAALAAIFLTACAATSPTSPPVDGPGPAVTGTSSAAASVAPALQLNGGIVFELAANASGALARTDALTKLDPGGKQVWLRAAGADTWIEGGALAPNGDVFAIESTTKDSPREAVVTRRASDSGKELWRATLVGEALALDAAAADASGGLVLVGRFYLKAELADAKGTKRSISGDKAFEGKRASSDLQMFIARFTPDGALSSASPLPNGGSVESLCVDGQGSAQVFGAISSMQAGGLQVGDGGPPLRYVASIDRADKFAWSHAILDADSVGMTCSREGATVVAASEGGKLTVRRWSGGAAEPLECAIDQATMNIHGVAPMGAGILVFGVPFDGNQLGKMFAVGLDEQCKEAWRQTVAEADVAATIRAAAIDGHTVVLGYTVGMSATVRVVDTK